MPHRLSTSKRVNPISPEERMREGAIKDFSVADNYVLEDHARPPFARGIFFNLNPSAAHPGFSRCLRRQNPQLAYPPEKPLGGNIQKLILARELSRHPRVLIASQPTRGVDIRRTANTSICAFWNSARREQPPC